MRLSPRTWLFAAAVLALPCVTGAGRAADPDAFTPADAASLAVSRLPLDVPADADAVAAIDVRRLVDSPVFQKYGKADALQGLQNPPVKALLAALGLNPLKDVDGLLIASSGDVMGNSPQVLLVARGTFDVARITAAAALYAKLNPAALKIAQVNGLTVYEGTTQGKTVYAHLQPDGAALLASTDKDYLLRAVQTPSPGPNPAMQSALARIPGDGAIRIAVVATDAMKNRLANTLARRLAPKLESLSISVGVTTEVTTRLTLYTTDEAGANDATGLLNQSDMLLLAVPALQPGPFGPLLQNVHDNVAILRDRNTVRVTIRLTQDFLEKAERLKNDALNKP